MTCCPEKRKLEHVAHQSKSQAKSASGERPLCIFPVRTLIVTLSAPKPIAAPVFKPPSPPRKSTIALAASAFQSNRASRLEALKDPTPRSTSFAEPVSTERAAPTRNEDMTVNEDLPIGPIDHPAPFDDPRWERMEPYSRIHLA